MKQVIVLRQLYPDGPDGPETRKIRAGKLIAQACHGSVNASKNAEEFNPPHYKEWIKSGTRKICVGVDTEVDLLKLYNSVVDLDLPYALVKDSGFTEFGGVATYTCLVIGPGPDEEIDKLTGKLKLL